ncbi:MAG TPA: CBS domain-containing protein, partial [Candidatus Sulfomarinibacteraceae bacterium]|nr:CBS domain-containing protein [Candidatus Sulfomarinibacteraceae bacterium]
HLRRVLKSGKHRSFPALVDIAAKRMSEVRRYRNDLKEYGQLRNAIVHDDSDDEHPIAEPHDDVTAQIERLAELILRPPRVYPTFKKDVQRLTPEQPIGRAVTHMYRNDFSQIPIYKDDSFQGLLSAVTVARWLGSEESGQRPDLDNTPIHRVLAFAEDKETHAFLSREATIAEAVFLFEESARNNRRLVAILITEHGKEHQAALGIITSGDLPHAHHLISLHRAQNHG